MGIFGYKYYLVILDDCSHYSWTFRYISNLRISPPSLTSSPTYPYTSPQNGKVKHMIRTTNDVMCSQLFYASLPARY
jgi:hypothetical protein